ncbi:hypothetical protein [Burkholderia sp. Tr-20390]|uniref:hypothetical protein n=1 Tax=Burkholderia sp. Tr-20390 TaxID=2703904 RepID=UPI00197E8302|nr:hypothetical protein [Burkholderia sp. Tr-20390]MBN3729664.1 hypothetical protein [Burkholderia sp. Tr-20390]
MVRSSTSKRDVIKYRSDDLQKFFCYIYEWIDNLNFCLPASDFVDDWREYEKNAGEQFLRHGWSGEGRVELMWLPPFALGSLLADGVDEFLDAVGSAWSNGLVVWHVKQDEDGLSFILSR